MTWKSKASYLQWQQWNTELKEHSCYSRDIFTLFSVWTIKTAAWPVALRRWNTEIQAIWIQDWEDVRLRQTSGYGGGMTWAQSLLLAKGSLGTSRMHYHPRMLWCRLRAAWGICFLQVPVHVHLPLTPSVNIDHHQVSITFFLFILSHDHYYTILFQD